jgi:hypothetical protein
MVSWCFIIGVDMKTFKPKQCRECGNTFTPKYPAELLCSEECKQQGVSRSRHKDHIRDMVSRGREDFIGVGKGGNAPTGTASPHWVSGIGVYKKLRNELFEMVGKVCQRCNKDLSEASPHHWCGHHIDHDRTNNTMDNIEIVCKSCHQIEHEVWKNFGTCNDYPHGE